MNEFVKFVDIIIVTVKSNRDVHYVLSNKDIIIDQSTSTIFVTIPVSKMDQKGATSTLAAKQNEGLDLISAMTHCFIFIFRFPVAAPIPNE
jgi:3-hydroxyisobutyrate dehydrogenase-like beta-hydroxyacid dehydrogenase